MAQRCIVSAYKFPAVTDGNNDASVGNFKLTLDALYVDTAVPGSGKYLSPIVVLDASTPGGWAAAIRQACADIGVANGFPSLTTANVLIPTVS